jgi:hypothetical protein
LISGSGDHHRGLTRRRLKRGVFRSIVDLQAAIHHYITEHKDYPEPFTWTKPADQILAKVNGLNTSVTRLVPSCGFRGGCSGLSLEPGDR